MLVKTLSVRQPYAALICAGVKTVENRTWKTDYRGRLLIHASGDSWAYPDFNYLPKTWQKTILNCIEKDDWTNASQEMLNYCEFINMAFDFYGKDRNNQEPPENWLKEAVKKYGFFMPSQAIIGEAVLFDIADNLFDANNDFAEPGCFYWKLSDAVLYEKPIINVIGRLRLWNFDIA